MFTDRPIRTTQLVTSNHFKKTNICPIDSMCKKTITKMWVNWYLVHSRWISKEKNFSNKIYIWKNNWIVWEIRWWGVELKFRIWHRRIRNIRSSSTDSLKRKCIGMEIIHIWFPAWRLSIRGLDNVILYLFLEFN